MKNRALRWTLKILSAILSFLLIFFLIQPFFVPSNIHESTPIVNGFFYLDQNSIDVLFMGSSQMFCSVDAEKLTNEYGISSYDFGANGQPLSVTPYYLETALKTQKPKVVMLEICKIFKPNDDIETEELSWNYDPMNMSLDKYRSLHTVLNGDVVKSFEYTVTPLLIYHDRWKSLNDSGHGGEGDIDYVLHPEKYINTTRGFWSRDHVESHEIAFQNGDESLREIPEECKEAVLDLSEKCKSNGIKLVLFKAPVSNWTKGDSLSVKRFTEENDLTFIDLNEKIDEIGIDKNEDFYNYEHLNVYGAEKTTDYLAIHLPEYTSISAN